MKTELPQWLNVNYTFDLDLSGMDMRVKCPKMNEIPSWKKHPNKADVFNSKVLYILFMYDKNSPVPKKYTDLEKRREVSIIESGINNVLVYEMNDQHFVQMIVEFLRYQNDRLWSLICMNESLFLQYSTILVQNTDSVKGGDKDLVATINLKEKVRENIMKVDSDLVLLYDKFYNGDKDLEKKVNETSRFTPETIAKKMKG